MGTKQITKRTKNGFTLVEILLVVGFIALASIGIYAVFNKVETNRKALETSRQVQLLAAGIKNLYADTNDLSTLTTQVVIDARIPQDTMIEGNTIKHVFGGTINIFGTNSGTFTIQLLNLDNEACYRIGTIVGPTSTRAFNGAAGMWFVNRASGSDSVDINRLIASCNLNAGVGMGLNFLYQSKY